MRYVYPLFLALTCTLFLTGIPASAKEVNLGGQKTEKLPANVIALATIAVAMRRDDGGWNNIKIDAWLASKDPDTAQKLEVAKNAIIARVDRELPNRPYETLQSPELGSVEAKKAIRRAVEAILGHAWNGEVLIHNMMVY